MTESMAQPRIDILLATYNGATFLDEQIGSILQQTHTNWRLLVRDDGSTDGTVGIVERYAKDHPDKIVPIADGDGNLGYAGNFSRLMAHSTADYLAFCDQDDVWLSEKLTLCLRRLRQLEQAHGAAAPVLVHSDLKVVDRDLGEICPSFWRYQGLDPTASNSLNRLLVQNVVTGCAALINRPLKALSLPVPAVAKAHDWWLTLVAAAFGSVSYVTEPTVLYRQHGRNAFGARAHGDETMIGGAIRFMRTFPTIRRGLAGTYAQAAAFWARYRTQLRAEDASLLREVVAIPELGPIDRFSSARRCGILPPRAGFGIAHMILTYRLDIAAKGRPARPGRAAAETNDGHANDSKGSLAPRR